MTWSQLTILQKVFTIATTVLTMAGVEVGLFWRWPQSAWLNKIMSIVINAVILAIVVKLLVAG